MWHFNLYWTYFGSSSGYVADQDFWPDYQIWYRVASTRISSLDCCLAILSYWRLYSITLKSEDHELNICYFGLEYGNTGWTCGLPRLKLRPGPNPQSGPALKTLGQGRIDRISGYTHRPAKYLALLSRYLDKVGLTGYPALEHLPAKYSASSLPYVKLRPGPNP